MRRRLAKLAVAALAVGLSGVGPFAVPAAAGPLPYGWLDDVQVNPSGELVVRGWTVDDDAPTAPVEVQIFDWSTLLHQGPAADPRPDVAAAYPHAGADHGFEVVLPAGEGPKRICVAALNVGAGEHRWLGCRDVVARTPYGWIDVAARFPDALRVRGWAADSDSPEPSAITVSVGGTGYGPFAADLPRPDVDAAYRAGPNHGFELALPLPPAGTWPVCVTALGVGPGGDGSLGCRDVVVSHTPVGWLDGVRGGDGFVRFTGWAFDPDSPEPIHIQVTTNGQFTYDVAAHQARPDVATVHPGAGPGRGFAFDVPTPAGDHTMCAYAVNVGPGPENVPLGCATVAVVPPNSGSGRRIVYHNLGQRVWIVDADGTVARSYFVSGRYNDPLPGNYRVYGWSRYAGTGGVTMEYFVAFHPVGLGYGFHTIPVGANGVPLQSESELGDFRSAGCVRQAWDDAVLLWNWSQLGDPVIVI